MRPALTDQIAGLPLHPPPLFHAVNVSAQPLDDAFF